MAAIKFTFDTHFDSGAARAEAVKKSRRSYSADEIDMIRRAAFGEGEKSGQVLAEQATTAALAQLSAVVGGAIAVIDEEVEAIRAYAAELSLACAKKLAGAALAAAPVDEIAAILRLALHEAIAEPRIVVKTPPAMTDEVKRRATEITAEQGFDGRIIFAAEPELSGGDCRIEWKGGGVEKSLAAIDTQLSELIRRRFSRAPDAKE